MGLIKSISSPLNSLMIVSGKTYYLRVVDNKNQILMNILNATQFFNLTDSEIKVFTDDTFSSHTIFKCDKFYWYNQNKTQLKYNHILSNENIIVFSCVNNGVLTFPNNNTQIKIYNVGFIQKKDLGQGKMLIS